MKAGAKILALLVIILFSTLVISTLSFKAKQTAKASIVIKPSSTDSSGNVKHREVDSFSAKPGASTSQFDDIIEPGWPVQTWHGPGTFHGGQAINTLVADINEDSYKEVIVTGLATGPLYAWDYEGNLLPGWPVDTTNGGAIYAATYEGDVVVGTWNADVAAFNYTGTKLWEDTKFNYIATPPSTEHLSSTSEGALFIEEEDWELHGYYTDDGSALSGWPFRGTGGQEMHTPAIADIDDDNEKEIISVSDNIIYAINEDGSELWHHVFPNTEVDTFPVVGDVDADGDLEVVVISSMDQSPWTDIINVIDPQGNVERSWLLSAGTGWGTAPALADMDGDKTPEIITITGGVWSDLFLEVFDGYGTPLPGWPLVLSEYETLGNTAPVAGDVDGDNLPEIVFTTEGWQDYTSYIYVVNHDGTMAESFPRFWRDYESGAVPAIADIDLDCHNEILITGDFWDGHSGYYDKVWAFDLSRDSENDIEKWGIDPHGKIEWGQFMSNEQNTGTYNPGRPICIHADDRIE